MSLSELFSLYIEKEFVFIEQGGNQGDLMIYLGARKLADAVGLKYRVIRCRHVSSVPVFQKDVVIYLNGGGGFAPWWNWTPKLLRLLRARNPHSLIIVGPTTVYRDIGYLKPFMPLSHNLEFYARENTSYEFLRKHFYPDVRLDHDTSLHLALGDGYLEQLIGDLRSKKLFQVLLVRCDVEKIQGLPQLVKERLKQHQYTVMCDPCFFKRSWAKLHVHAALITANRSHSAILGSLLNKTVELFHCRYHKNRSIWEYSLNDRGVKWIG